MKNPPIKRHQALQNLSREHHDILVFALRLKKGIAHQAPANDLQAYADWFWEDYLAAHFQLEEERLFPLLGNTHDLVVKAMHQHRALQSLFQLSPKKHSDFFELLQQLQQHIRFEERELFQVMQETVNENDLLKFSKIHQKQQVCGVWKKVFWKK